MLRKYSDQLEMKKISKMKKSSSEIEITSSPPTNDNSFDDDLKIPLLTKDNVKHTNSLSLCGDEKLRLPSSLNTSRDLSKQHDGKKFFMTNKSRSNIEIFTTSPVDNKLESQRLLVEEETKMGVEVHRYPSYQWKFNDKKNDNYVNRMNISEDAKVDATPSTNDIELKCLRGQENSLIQSLEISMDTETSCIYVTGNECNEDSCTTMQIDSTTTETSKLLPVPHNCESKHWKTKHFKEPKDEHFETVWTSYLAGRITNNGTPNDWASNLNNIRKIDDRSNEWRTYIYEIESHISSKNEWRSYIK